MKAAMIVLAVVSAVLAVAVVALIVDVRALQANTAAQQHVAITQRRAETAQQAKIAILASNLASLSRPSDPLAAYNDICNQDFINNSTGADQVYYFPCTNQAQTIPQPGY